jgi:hypothetical protein
MEFVTIFKTFNPAEAELISTQLQAAGFDVTLRNEYSALTLPPAAASGVWVQVPEDQAADARELIDTNVNPPAESAS